MSSPGLYWRTSEKAMPLPLKTEWYCPAIRSRTRRSVTISMLRIFLSRSRVSMATIEPIAPHRDARAARSRNLDPFEQLAHHQLGGDVLGLGLVRQDDPVAKHIDPDRLHVFGGHVAAAAQKRVGARRQV